MGAGFHGGFRSGCEKLKVSFSQLDLNAMAMMDIYPYSEHGFFGKKGKNSRVIKTSDPEAVSIDFYKRLSIGGTVVPLSNGKGTKTVFADSCATITHRIVTSTKGSPAVDVNVSYSLLVKSQKIHFVLEDK